MNPTAPRRQKPPRLPQGVRDTRLTLRAGDEKRVLHLREVSGRFVVTEERENRITGSRDTCRVSYETKASATRVFKKKVRCLRIWHFLAES